jgi:hypothetical protein
VTITTATIAAVTAYLTAYAKAKGLNRATQEDLRQALERLQATTNTVEEVKSRFALRDATGTELRQAIREFASASSSLVHSMCWVLWNARARGRLDSALAKQYDDEAHKTMPLLLSNLATIAALSPDAHDRLCGYMDALFDHDGDIGAAIVAYEADAKRGLLLLIDCHKRAIALERQLRSIISGIAQQPITHIAETSVA